MNDTPDPIPTTAAGLAAFLGSCDNHAAVRARLLAQEGPRRTNRVWAAAIRRMARDADTARRRAAARATRGDVAPRGRRPVGEVTTSPTARHPRGTSRQKKVKLLDGQLEALDALAVHTTVTTRQDARTAGTPLPPVVSRAELLRVAARDVLQRPPTAEELAAAAGPAGPERVWIPGPGDHAKLMALAERMTAGEGSRVTLWALLRCGVARLLAQSNAVPERSS